MVLAGNVVAMKNGLIAVADRPKDVMTSAVSGIMVGLWVRHPYAAR